MPDKTLADLTVVVERAEDALRKARDEASAAITSHIDAHLKQLTLHQAEIAAAKALKQRVTGVIEDAAAEAASFVLTGRSNPRAITRLVIIGAAAVIIVYGVFAHLF